MKQRLIDVVPKHAISLNMEKRLIIDTPHGYIRFNHMVMDAELLEGLPQMTIDMMHNKLLIQHGLVVDGDGWLNIGRFIMDPTIPVNRTAASAVAWLSGMIKIKEFLQ